MSLSQEIDPEIRQARQDSPESRRRKLVTALYPGALKPFARGFYNRDNMIENRFSRLVSQNHPIELLAFWGVGDKVALDRYDFALLEEFQKIQAAVAAVYPKGVNLQLILADSHGNFNDYKGFEPYLEAVATAARGIGIVPVTLSNLYKQWGIALPDSQNPPDQFSDTYDVWGSPAYYRQRQQLIESAARHSRQEGIDPEQLAYWYLDMRRREQQPLVATFPDSLLLVNSSKELGRLVLPDNIPHMYLKVDPAWFKKDDVG